MTISLLSVGINLATAWTLTHYHILGHAGLALSTSVVASFGFVAVRSGSCAIASAGLRPRAANTVMKVIAASLTMGAVTWMTSAAMTSRFGEGRTGHLLDLFVSIPIGLGIYYGMCRILKVNDLDSAFLAIAGPIIRRLKR